MSERINVAELSFELEPYIWKSSIEGLVVISRPYYPDPRGSFQENFRYSGLTEAGVVVEEIKQSSTSEMVPGTIKGIHCERQHKILQPITGKYLFVEVDLRPESETFKEWVMIEVDANAGRRATLHVPSGVGNSMCILEPGKGSDRAILVYSVTAEYDSQEAKRVVKYDDPDFSYTLAG